MSRSFVAELKRRNVHRAVLFYAGAAWVLVQIATQVFPFFDIPNRAVRVVVVAAIVGLPFATLFSWFYEWTPQGIKRETEVERSESVTLETGKKLDRLIIAVLGFAVVLLLTDKFLLSKGVTDKSIAVLPFVNTTGDAANEYFSDGLSEELIAALGRLHDLKVIGRTSSFQFKGKTEDSKAIGDKLGVSTLLGGSVRMQAQRVRIVAELVNVVDGRQLWSETYDRELKDIFAVQSEIADAVASQLKVALLGAEAKTAAPTIPSNQNVEAYTALLQANFHLQRRSVADYRTAIGYYEAAIKADPRYALAYARLSTASIVLATRFVGIGSAEGKASIARGRAAAETAVALDPALADAHLAVGTIRELIDLDLVRATAEYDRAAELAPNEPKILQVLSNMKSRFGQFDEAAALLRQVLASDPLRTGSYYNLAVDLTALGRYDEAEAALNKGAELQPKAAQNFQQRAVVKILRGDSAAAVELARQEPDEFWRTFSLSLAYFAHGDRALADEQLKKLIDESANDSGSQIASIYALRKEPDKAFEWLEHAWETHDGGVLELLYDPFLRAYKDDPRYIAFARKVGVMPAAAN